MSESDVDELHRRMQAEIAASGGSIDSIYYCPHEGGCDCRKPGTALLERAARELELDLGKAVVIGDRLSDIHAGIAVGAQPSTCLRTWTNQRRVCWPITSQTT